MEGGLQYNVYTHSCILYIYANSLIDQTVHQFWDGYNSEIGGIVTIALGWQDFVHQQHLPLFGCVLNMFQKLAWWVL